MPVSPCATAYPVVLLAIDPGTDSGWAIFFGGMLIACGLGNDPHPTPKAGDCFKLVVVEHPVIYPSGKTRNPNDIVKLAVNAGEWAGRYRATGAEIRFVEPRAWKGTIDGDACNARVWARLDDGEKTVLDDAVRTQKIPGRKRHNVLDAIGIGLHVSGRWRA